MKTSKQSHEDPGDIIDRLERTLREKDAQLLTLKGQLSLEQAARGRSEKAQRDLEQERDQLVKQFRLQMPITERKLAEAQLTDWKNRYEAVLLSSGQILYDRVPGTNEVTYGGSYERILGYSEAEMSGGLSQWTDRIHPEDREEFRREMKRVVATRKPFHLEYRVQKKDGSYMIAKDDGYFFLDRAGSLDRMVGFVVDITDQRRLEQRLVQAQKMEAVGSLAGGVAHDFNNLLTIIKGYCDLSLGHMDADNPLRSNIEAISDSAARAAALTRQLLAFSRKQKLAPQVLDLNTAVSNMDRMLQRLIGEDVNLITRLQPELDYVKADPVQIEQIVMNLAVNARDAMPRGGNLIIETKNVELDEDYATKQLGVEPGHYIMLAVSDSGIGMDAETRSRIFEPFFTTKEKEKGTGLGLSTVYGIVKQSGGYIWVYSEPERGTTFKIYFPRVQEALEPAAVVETKPQPQGGSETILLVEDEEGVRTLTRKILERDGYNVLEAQNGEEALWLARHYRGSVDLMVTDVVMPGMSGRTLAESLAPQLPHLKVLFLSGYTDDTIVQHGILKPEMSFLQKPFTAGTLSRKVREVLDTHSTQDLS